MFGSAAGIGDGAQALWEVARAQGHEAVWLVNSDREARAAAEQGIATVPKMSVAGWWATARAGVIVVTHGFGDVNRYATAGAFVVQLWHGIPLKRIGLDSPITVQTPLLSRSRWGRAVMRALYRGTQSAIDVLPAASHRARGRLESAFGLPPGRVVVTGEPRVDVLSQGEPAERRRAGRTRIATALLDSGQQLIPDDHRVIIYAPTWRDGADDPAIPDASDWAAIDSLLRKHKATLLIRSHPLGEGQYIVPTTVENVRMLGSSAASDVTPLLPGIDVLVTDYSSMAFDVGLLRMPVVYLAPDVAQYARTRGFYGRYRDVAGTDYARTWGEAIAQLDRLLDDADEFSVRAEQSAALSEKVHAFRDGGNARRVYEIIRARVARVRQNQFSGRPRLGRRETL